MASTKNLKKLQTINAKKDKKALEVSELDQEAQNLSQELDIELGQLVMEKLKTSDYEAAFSFVESIEPLLNFESKEG